MPWVCVAAHCRPNDDGCFGAHLHMEGGPVATQGAVFVEMVRIHLKQTVKAEQFEAARRLLAAINSAMVSPEIQDACPDRVECEVCVLNTHILKQRHATWYSSKAYDKITTASSEDWLKLADHDLRRDLKVGHIWKELMMAVWMLPDSSVQWMSGGQLQFEARNIFIAIPSMTRLENFWACCSCYLLQCLGFGQWSVKTTSGHDRKAWEFKRYKLDDAWWKTSAAMGVVALGLHTIDNPVLAHCKPLQDRDAPALAGLEEFRDELVWIGGDMETALSFLGLPRFNDCNSILEDLKPGMVQNHGGGGGNEVRSCIVTPPVLKEGAPISQSGDASGNCSSRH